MPKTIAKCIDCHKPIVIACPPDSKQEWHDRCIACAYDHDPALQRLLPTIVAFKGLTVDQFLDAVRKKQAAAEDE